jgi:hypothetical protein
VHKYQFSKEWKKSLFILYLFLCRMFRSLTRTVFGSLEVCSKIQILSRYLLNILCTQYLFLRHIILENKKQNDFWYNKF